MSGQRHAQYAHAIVKFSRADEDLYNARFDTADWLSADAQRRADAQRSFDRLSRSLDGVTLGRKLEQLRDQGTTVSFRRMDPSQTWQQLRAEDARGAALANRTGAQFTSTQLETYYRFDVTSSPTRNDAVRSLHELVDLLRQLGGAVEMAYVSSDAAAPPAAAPPATHPNLQRLKCESRSHFKSARKAGMGIRYFQNATSSSGQGVSFVDLEHGWILENDDLPKIPATALIAGSNIHDSPVYPTAAYPNPEEKFNYCLHGLMVLGLLIAKPNGNKITGIAPYARPLLASIEVYDDVTRTHMPNTLAALNQAIANLSLGDVLLIEAQQMPPAQVGGTPVSFLNVPIEANPALRAAITTATNNGIIVIEPAGNNVPAGISLDDVTFPSNPDWKLDPADRSLAIVVAAGSNESGVTYQRAKTTNHGAFIDCFADGDFIWVLNSEPPEHDGSWPPEFIVSGGGTSSAAAIIAGVALILQSHAKSQGKLILPALMREILRFPNFGTASLYPNDGIGTMPDMRKIYNDLPAILAAAAPYP